MSAAQPIKQVQDLGSLSTSSTARVVGDNFIVTTGIMHASTTVAKNGGHVGVCNTTTSNVGVTSIHVNKDDDILLRIGHPVSATVIGITTGATTTVSVNHPDTKLKVGDFVTMTGSTPVLYNTTLRHVEVTAVSTPQRWNGYAMTVTLDADTSTGHAAFSGEATISKSVIPLVYGDSASGCDVFLTEVQLG
mgnify:CR=1 FL=1